MIFAKEIASKTKIATVILAGRSCLNEEKQGRLKALESLGARIDYRQADISEQEEVEDLVQSIVENFGKINGILHCAGVIRDNFILKKTVKEFHEVLPPKVAGTVCLDQITRDLELDFFVLFSSVTGNMGNAGQADYACANAYLDAYARYRNTLVGCGQRHGWTLSINWPLWKEGGMQVDEAIETMMRQNIGMLAMQTRTGLQALYQALASGQPQVMVVEGQLKRMKQKLFSGKTPTLPKPEETSARVDVSIIMDTSELLSKVQRKLMQAVSKLLKVKIEDLDVDAELSDYGFDSITLTEFSNRLNQQYKLELAPTVFYEHPTMADIANYLIDEHRAVFTAQFAVQGKAKSLEPSRVEEVEGGLSTRKVRPRFANRMAVATGSEPERTSPEPIAIVGMSGSFPMARNVEAFWENLKAGKDCVREIPKSRWDWEAVYGDPNQEGNKTNIKWGGFIEGVDEFDPLFFGISPREAELMDPQQRLLMIYVWKAIEDAGYSATSLSGSKTAIFVGTASSGYSQLISQANIAIEGYSSTGMVPSVGPNRMSYFLNLHGPSEPIETACSSSLVAIHRGILALETGSCEMVVVGGVNTLISPEAHISFNKAGMLCEDGRCKAFSRQANGYVRGEGVGMLLLKKLKAAEEAGDHIYGMIRGSAENHGGRASSLTAPNPKAQAVLLKAAYSKAGIDPRSVSYIEAHGTGTELGDPIEINGLKRAFKELYEMTGDAHISDTHCGVGSVKSNIGHSELAAGIAGVIKVLLQLEHKTLVKSLHCEELNPYIDLKETPFYIVQENKAWRPLQDAQGQELPRRAGVSSFGFGGSNAHVILEEYIRRSQVRNQKLAKPQAGSESYTDHPALIVLSAKNEDRLKDATKNLHAYLNSVHHQPSSINHLYDLAYTLQVGREAMQERLGLIVRSIEKLKEKLQGFMEGQEDVEDLYRGQVERNKETLADFAADEELQEAVEKWIQRQKYYKLLEFWAKGFVFDWTKLYGDVRPRRMSLPTYPFAKERYWVQKTKIRRESSSLSIKGNGKFDEKFCSELLDEVTHDRISVEDATKKISLLN